MARGKKLPKLRALPELGDDVPSQNCDTVNWRLHTYVSSTGRGEVQDAVDHFSDNSLLKFGTQVRYLRVLTIREWTEPQAKKLQGDAAAGLYEIRWKDVNVQVRAIGFHQAAAQIFTITIICTHKDNVYKPHDSLRTAARRRTEVLSGEASTSPLLVDGEEFPPTDEG